MFRFLRSVSHVIISTQKYILTRVSGHDKRVTWPYIFSYYHRSKIKQKLREKLKHQGLSGIFQIPPSLPPTRTLFPLSVCLDSIVDSPWILYLSKLNSQNQLFKDISRSNTNNTKTFTKFHIWGAGHSVITQMNCQHSVVFYFSLPYDILLSPPWWWSIFIGVSGHVHTQNFMRVNETSGFGRCVDLWNFVILLSVAPHLCLLFFSRIDISLHFFFPSFSFLLFSF